MSPIVPPAAATLPKIATARAPMPAVPMPAVIAGFALPGAALPELIADSASALVGALPKRLKLAGDGKSLPDQADEHGKAKGDRTTSPDPAFGWMAIVLPPVLPRAQLAAPNAHGGGGADQKPAAAPTVSGDIANAVPPARIAGAPAPDSAPAQNAAQPAGTPEVIASPDFARVSSDPKGADIASQAGAAPEKAREVHMAPPAAPAQVASQPAQPALRAFAAAMIAARADNAAPETRKPEQDSAAPIAPPAAAGQTRTHEVQPTGENQRAPLDLTQDKGLKGMIDRIETLRDNADANDTRIRLAPAGLGTVDVAVRKDGDVVHVHFTADQPATRSLIADAQPRLTELAEARGIRLGETSVASGGGNSGHPQHAFTQQHAAAPRPVSATHETAIIDADARVA